MSVEFAVCGLSPEVVYEVLLSTFEYRPEEGGMTCQEVKSANDRQLICLTRRSSVAVRQAFQKPGDLLSRSVK